MRLYTNATRRRSPRQTTVLNVLTYVIRDSDVWRDKGLPVPITSARLIDSGMDDSIIIFIPECFAHIRSYFNFMNIFISPTGKMTDTKQ